MREPSTKTKEIKEIGGKIVAYQGRMQTRKDPEEKVLLPQIIYPLRKQSQMEEEKESSMIIA